MPQIEHIEVAPGTQPFLGFDAIKIYVIVKISDVSYEHYVIKYSLDALLDLSLRVGVDTTFRFYPLEDTTPVERTVVVDQRNRTAYTLGFVQATYNPFTGMTVQGDHTPEALRMNS